MGRYNNNDDDFWQRGNRRRSRSLIELFLIACVLSIRLIRLWVKAYVRPFISQTNLKGEMFSMSDNQQVGNFKKLTKKQKAKKILLFGIIAIIVVGWMPMTESVNRGEYHILQIPITGTVKAIHDTGIYAQLFGDKDVWNVSETFYFTSDKDTEDDNDKNLAIKVRFAAGSECGVSGTCRVDLPRNEKQAVAIVTKLGYKDYNDLQERLIKPLVRKALRGTANMMTAQESYSTLRSDFIRDAWDQIENGIYLFENEDRQIDNPDWIRPKLADGTFDWKAKAPQITKPFKIKKIVNGDIIREKNPLEGTGITLANFEIKSFDYSDTVRKQISDQQKNIMAIRTSITLAKKAQQDMITKESEGKAKLMEVRYAQLKEKEKKVIVAQETAETRTIAAQGRLDVAKLDKASAVETKAKLILEGEGEAGKRKLIKSSDDNFKLKVEAYKYVMDKAFDAYGTRNVPEYMNITTGNGEGGGSNLDSQFVDYMNTMKISALKDLGLDLGMKSKK